MTSIGSPLVPFYSKTHYKIRATTFNAVLWSQRGDHNNIASRNIQYWIKCCYEGSVRGRAAAELLGGGGARGGDLPGAGAGVCPGCPDGRGRG